MRSPPRRRAVRCLAVFGSATGESYDPSRSDLDVVMGFEPLPLGQKGDVYFGLLGDVENLSDIADLRRIISFRNRLIPDYATVVYCAP